MILLTQMDQQSIQYLVKLKCCRINYNKLIEKSPEEDSYSHHCDGVEVQDPLPHRLLIQGILFPLESRLFFWCQLWNVFLLLDATQPVDGCPQT